VSSRSFRSFVACTPCSSPATLLNTLLLHDALHENPPR
jgi:hypothetical protein